MKARTLKKRRSRLEASIARTMRRLHDSHWRIWEGTETDAGRHAAFFEHELRWLIEGVPVPKKITYPWLKPELGYQWHRRTNTAAAPSWAETSIDDMMATLDREMATMTLGRSTVGAPTLFSIPESLRSDDDFTFRIEPRSLWYGVR